MRIVQRIGVCACLLACAVLAGCIHVEREHHRGMNAPPPAMAGQVLPA